MAAGFGFALAWTAREDSLFYLSAAGLFLLIHRRDRLAAFISGAVLPIALNSAYWRAYSGSLWRPPYYEMQADLFGGLDVHALVAMLVSPSRGLLFFFPAVIFGLWGAAKACRNPRTRWVPYMALASIAMWVFVAFRISWVGGTTFGTRYFALPCMTLAIFAGEPEDEIRKSSRLSAAWAGTRPASSYAAVPTSVARHPTGPKDKPPRSGTSDSSPPTLHDGVPSAPLPSRGGRCTR